MHTDSEISALNNVYETLKILNNAQIKRILDWVTSKFELDKQPGLKAAAREAAPSPGPGPLPEVSPGQFAPPAEAPVKKRRGRRPAAVEPVIEKPVPQPGAAPQPIEAPVTSGFIKYDNFEELLLFSTAHTNTAKILLAAAYLQEKKNLKEFGSYDITTLFREIGEEVNQPSAALNNLISKKPPLLTQTGTQGPGLKSRRNFRVTEEGLRIARNYLKE